MNELKIENVSKIFDGKAVVKNISANLSNGIYGLIGANGAGKTTLMNILCNFINPSQGEVYYNGESILKLGDNYRDILGYLPQNFGCDSSFTVEQYLEYIATLKGLSKELTSTRIDEIIRQTGLVAYRNIKIAKLSGGTRQRVGISQALLNDPKVLILDEPTSGLDPGERLYFRKIILNISTDKIILLSTHIISDIEVMPIKENLIMSNGQLLAKGSNEELLKTLSGKIWSTIIFQHDYSSFSEKYYVLDSHNIEGDRMSVRFYSKEDMNLKDGEIKSEEPTLDDYYQFVFHENLRERGYV